MAKPYFQGWYFKIQTAPPDSTREGRSATAYGAPPAPPDSTREGRSATAYGAPPAPPDSTREGRSATAYGAPPAPPARIRTIAFIPAKHTDFHGNPTASLQVITDAGAWNVPFPGHQYIEHEEPFFVRVGENFFSEDGMELSFTTPELTVKGSVKFQQITPIAYDIMGPFCHVPFMECRHSVFSMTHRVDGCLTVNGEKYIFDNAIGYIEGDRGRSFPKEYLWTQCNFIDDCGGPASLMLSVADIPLAGLHFTGIISVILWKGKEYRLATYLGAKAVRIAAGAVTVRQGPYTLTARLVEKHPHPLQAPVAGAMTRLIRESPACRARYIFSRKGRTIFFLDTDKAAFEYEYGK